MVVTFVTRIFLTLFGTVFCAVAACLWFITVCTKANVASWITSFRSLSRRVLRLRGLRGWCRCCRQSTGIHTVNSVMGKTWITRIFLTLMPAIDRTKLASSRTSVFASALISLTGNAIVVKTLVTRIFLTLIGTVFCAVSSCFRSGSVSTNADISSVVGFLGGWGLGSRWLSCWSLSAWSLCDWGLSGWCLCCWSLCCWCLCGWCLCGWGLSGWSLSGWSLSCWGLSCWGLS